MAKKKKRRTSKKQNTDEVSRSAGFWQLVGAVLMFVLGVFLVFGRFWHWGFISNFQFPLGVLGYRLDSLFSTGSFDLFWVS